MPRTRRRRIGRIRRNSIQIRIPRWLQLRDVGPHLRDNHGIGYKWNPLTDKPYFYDRCTGLVTFR